MVEVEEKLRGTSVMSAGAIFAFGSLNGTQTSFVAARLFTGGGGLATTTVRALLLSVVVSAEGRLRSAVGKAGVQGMSPVVGTFQLVYTAVAIPRATAPSAVCDLPTEAIGVGAVGDRFPISAAKGVDMFASQGLVASGSTTRGGKSTQTRKGAAKTSLTLVTASIVAVVDCSLRGTCCGGSKLSEFPPA